MKIDRFPLYEFHEDGYVVSLTRKNPFVMKPIKMGLYCGLQLKRDDGLLEKIYLHRAIAEACYGPCPEGLECRHLDGDKTNNAGSNLAWGTRSQNSKDKEAHGCSVLGENNPMAKLTEEEVLRMRQVRKETGLSYAKIALQFGVSSMTAYRAITGQSWENLDG